MSKGSSKSTHVTQSREVAALTRRLAMLVLVLVAGCTSQPQSTPTDAPDWQPVQLPGKQPTAYSRGNCEGRRAWLAKSESAVSLWRRRVEAEVTPDTTAEFSWWVPRTIPTADLRFADTADSPVRVLFAFSGDASRLSMRTRLQFQLAETLTGEAPPYATLMYVWDNRAELETVLPGARSDRVRKIVVERGDANLRRWLTYKRELKADFERAFGEPPGRLIGIALLTDTDNTRSKAEACYGDVLVRP
jgi:hypothetical protein